MSHDKTHGAADHLEPYEHTVVFAHKGTAGVAVGTLRWYNDTGRTLTFVKARISAGTPPQGGSLLADLNLDGASIWPTTQSNRLTLNANESTSTRQGFEVTHIDDGHFLTCDIDQIGPATPGGDLAIQMVLRG